MKIKSADTKINLKVNEPESSAENLALLPVQPAAPAHLDAQTVRHHIQKTQVPMVLNTAQHLVDIVIVASLGTLVSFVTMFVVSILLPGHRHLGVISLLDLYVSVALAGFTIYFLCAIVPISLALCALLLQALSGVYVGQVMVDFICNWFLVDPQTLGSGHVILSALFTFVFTILPAFAMPLYRAALESSPLRRTIGAATSDHLVADLKGNRLSFAHAWKRSVVHSFISFLYQIDVARGKDYRDMNSWFEQTTGTMHVKKQEKLDEEIRKSKDTVRVRYRAFQELETFLGPDQQNLPKVMQKEDLPFKRAYHAVRALLSVTIFVLVPTLFLAPAAFMRIFLLKGSFNSWLTPFLTAIEKLLFVDFPQFVIFIVFALLGYVVLAACRPTHIELTRDGVRFIFGTMPIFMQERVCPWSKVKRISLVQVAGKASVADHRLVFELTDGNSFRLRLGSISSVVGKEEILKAVERWAPTTPRSAEVISALQPPCDFSYAELWMEALSAPPKREKLKPLSAGATLGEHQFTVLNMLGVGGQGTAYLAEDAMSGQRVVLKEFVLPVYVEVSARRRALEIFEKEARLLKELSHLNVVKLVDYFVEDHRVYLVLEHIDGESLRTLVNRAGVMDETRVRQLASQMCEILEYLHSQTPPVVHRDFTPDNLILRKDGTLKLIDFNVAQQTDASIVSSVVGKPAYLPPEQFRGTPTTQSDIYAMGGCMQFLLTGEDPVAILSSNPSLSRDDISPELSSIVQKATEPELEARFATAGEILELLRNRATDSATESSSSSSTKPSSDQDQS